MIRAVLVGGAAQGRRYIEAAMGDLVELSEVPRTEAAVLEAAPGAEALVTFLLPARLPAVAPNLRLAQAYGAGVDGLDLAALPEGCRLCNCHFHETAIGEYVVMTALALTRRLFEYDRRLRAGDWQNGHSFTGTPEHQLRGLTLGMVGFGPIGQEVARLAGALGMEILAVTRRPETHTRAEVAWMGGLDQMDELLARSHVVVLALPLTAETRGLLGRERLAHMRPGSHLINVGRGALVDEEALYEALSSGHLGGAALDVWYRYPESPGAITMPATRPFWELPNVILTPHMSGWTESTLRGRFTFVGQQLARLSRGEELLNVLHVGGAS